jgi:hypothetical protein
MHNRMQHSKVKVTWRQHFLEEQTLNNINIKFLIADERLSTRKNRGKEEQKI